MPNINFTHFTGITTNITELVAKLTLTVSVVDQCCGFKRYQWVQFPAGLEVAFLQLPVVPAKNTKFQQCSLP